MLRHYIVSIRPDGRWQGVSENAQKPLVLADTQHEAEELLCAMVMSMGHTQVLIFDAAGKVLRAEVFKQAAL